MTAVMVAMARDLTLQPESGAGEEPATIRARKALVEACKVNMQLFLQWQALDHLFRGRAVDAQALGRTGLSQLAQGEVLGQPPIVSPGNR
jgi:hypothetical protein